MKYVLISKTGGVVTKVFTMLCSIKQIKINLLLFRIVTLDEIFSIINLNDSDIQQKVWKLFQPEIANEFLGNDLYKLAEKYKLVMPFPNAPTKMLIKKQ